MQRAFFSFFLLMLVLVGGLNMAGATRLPRPEAVKDTIVVRLPNRATLTLLVRDAAQLRQLKNYHLDSLTSQLATYISQAETAAKTARTEQVTMEFYPDHDQPGKNLPEQVRITTHRKATNSSHVDVALNKAFGIQVTTDDKGVKSYNTADTETKAQRKAHRDSTRLKEFERKSVSTSLVVDLGLNAFVNQKQYRTANGQAETIDLRPGGSRYLSLGLITYARLFGKRSPILFSLGPEFSFNNYMLDGNDKWVAVNGRTDVVRETDGRQFEKTKLATSSINVPLMLHLQLRDAHYKPTFTLGVGGFAGYRLAAWTKLKYTTDGTTYKNKNHDNYNLENFQYGLLGTIGYRDLEFFGKYNLNGLFKAGAGPDTQVLSFGVRIFGLN